MMLTGKDIDTKLEIERFIENYTDLYFSRINIEDYMYLDEVYTSIASKIDRIKRIGQVEYNPIDDNDFVEEDHLQSFTEDYRTISDINYRMIPELFSGLQRISDNILNISTKVNQLTYNSETAFKAVKEEIKNKLVRKAIKEETTIYDSIGPGSKFSPENTQSSSSTTLKELTIDEQAKSITLPIGELVEIPFSIEIECDKSKGEYMPAAFGSKTFDSITNGYFNSRMFAVNPKLELEELDSNLENLEDQDPETSYSMEYNSYSNNDSLNVKLKLSFDDTKVNKVKIIFEPLGSESTVGMSNVYPTLLNIQLENSNPDSAVSENVTGQLLDNTIDVNGRKLGDYNTGVSYSGKEAFPMASYIINTPEISNILLEYKLEIPQEIYYLEKAVFNANGYESYRFNYFETLVLNNYIVPENRKAPAGVMDYPSDPYSYYDAEDLSEMNEIIKTAYMIQDMKIKMYRYMIGIKDIRLYKTPYIPVGSITTQNLLPIGKTVACVELFVNEVTDDETSIKYSFSTDNSTWVEIIPSNRITASTRNKRMVFQGFEAQTGDIVVPAECSSLYMKVDMTGTQTKTPILKAYSIKVKYI